MGFFDLFKKKSQTVTSESLVSKYFDGSKDNVFSDAEKLIETTKFDVTQSEMVTMLIRCLCYRELNVGWSTKVLESLQKDSLGKLPEVELKWLFCYCDAHYVNKGSGNELYLIMEQAGRQIGMPSPLGDISSNYKFK